MEGQNLVLEGQGCPDTDIQTHAGEPLAAAKKSYPRPGTKPNHVFLTAMDEQNGTETKQYPAPGTLVDHIFENESDEEMGIETITYPNGGKSKTVKLSDGRIAVTRRLKGHDMIEAGKQANGAQERARAAMASVATRIDGNPLLLDDFLNMWSSDFTLINSMCNDLNF